MNGTASPRNSAPEATLRSFVGRYDPKHQKFIRAVRGAMRKRFPTANELAYDYSSFFLISYSPTDRGIDSIVSIAARPDRVDLCFNHGPKLPDPKKLLQGSGRLTRFIRVDSIRLLANADVKAFISAAQGLVRVPLPARVKGCLIIKTDKSGAAKKRPRRKGAAR